MSDNCVVPRIPKAKFKRWSMDRHIGYNLSMFKGPLKTKLFPPPLRSNKEKRDDLLAKFALALQRGISCTLVYASVGFGTHCYSLLPQPMPVRSL